MAPDSLVRARPSRQSAPGRVIGWTLAACAVFGLTGDPSAAGEPIGAAAGVRLVVTVDDLPVAPPGSHTLAQQNPITERLLEVLAARAVPAVGFVNEGKLAGRGGEVDPRRVGMLERWLDAGFELGNHGYDHLDLHRVEPRLWLEDIARGERVTRGLLQRRGLPLRWFRHPFLHVGRSAGVQAETDLRLAERGYRVAPVTIDNGEWIYGAAYARAFNRGDHELMRRLGEDYLRYMSEVVEYYEGQAQSIAGGTIPQVLLVHAYALNADWLAPLLDRLQARGYHFVSLESALEDPAYSRPIDGYIGAGGISWLHRWAITAGLDRAVFAGEPEVPAWVEVLSRTPEHPEPTPRALTVERVEVHDLVASSNGVSYELRVSLPHGYGDGEKRYPVVYTLDADYSFLIARGITDHLSEREHLEEVIVVGVAYGGPLQYRKHRTRDYTPSFVPEGGYGPEYQQFSGGAPKFAQALERDLIPFIERTYRTERRDRTLVGHSYGGLFAVWTLLTQPGLFDNFVAVSPSLWYDERLPLRLEAEFPKSHRSLPARLYLCAGALENERMPGDLRDLAAQLQLRNYRDLQWRSLVMEGETHNSIFPGCLSNGLRFVLEGR